jgi:hypothetical protein
MKKLIPLLALIATTAIFAQAPQGFNYQATVRNSTGALIVNQIVLVKFNILLNSTTGTLVYSENQTATTDDLGHINLVVGQGTATTGTFSTINWGTGNYYLGIELDSGSGYIAMGTTQLLSVPYALYSQNSSTPTIQQVLDAGNIATKTTNTTEGSSLRINTVGGSTSGEFYYGIRSHIDGTNGNNRGILAASNGVSQGVNWGLTSYASNSAIENIGVYARGNTLAGTVSSGHNTGVQGVAYGSINGNDNRGTIGYASGVTATGRNYGITGASKGSEVFNIAVGAYSELGNTTSGTNYGVSARASSVTTTGTNYGIYSEASNGATNYAGFFNGNVTVTGTFVQPSDRKLKKDIKPFVSALDKINALSPVTYYYKNDKESGINLPTNLQYGFIAQDLETVFPELVTNQVLNLATTGNGGNNKASRDLDENGLVSENTGTVANPIEKTTKEEFKGINYTGLISILTEAIKEQQVLLLELKKQNKSLTKRVNNLEKKIKK